VPVETWMQHRSFVVRVDGSKAVRSATIDPDQRVPDEDRSNNTFTVR